MQPVFLNFHTFHGLAHYVAVMFDAWEMKSAGGLCLKHKSTVLVLDLLVLLGWP